jgi:hypothetical protein
MMLCSWCACFWNSRRQSCLAPRTAAAAPSSSMHTLRIPSGIAPSGRSGSSSLSRSGPAGGIAGSSPPHSKSAKPLLNAKAICAATPAFSASSKCSSVGANAGSAKPSSISCSSRCSRAFASAPCSCRSHRALAARKAFSGMPRTVLLRFARLYSACLRFLSALCSSVSCARCFCMRHLASALLSSSVRRRLASRAASALFGWWTAKPTASPDCDRASPLDERRRRPMLLLCDLTFILC